MRVLPGILSLLAAIAGWYYMFYSTAASKLGGIEEERTNRRRVRLRRIGGFLMFALAVCFYAGFYTVDEKQPALFLLIWISAFILLLLIVLLALIDVRLTGKLRRKRPEPPFFKPPPSP